MRKRKEFLPLKHPVHSDTIDVTANFMGNGKEKPVFSRAYGKYRAYFGFCFILRKIFLKKFLP